MRTYVHGEESGMRKGKLETYGSKTSEINGPIVRRAVADILGSFFFSSLHFHRFLAPLSFLRPSPFIYISAAKSNSAIRDLNNLFPRANVSRRTRELNRSRLKGKKVHSARLYIADDNAVRQRAPFS